MPWEFVASYLATKALDWYGPRVASAARRLFVEARPRRGQHTLADDYLTLSGSALTDFYRGEEALEVTLAGQTYVIPATLDDPPTGDGTLAVQRLTWRISPSLFELDPALDSFVLPVRRAAETDERFFNGRVVRCVALSGAEGQLSPASYFDALATNFAMDHRPAGRSESLREFVQGSSRALGDFRSSKLVNHIGVVCMMETADGMLVAQRRNVRVANRPASISASVSGGLKWTDVWKGDPDACLSMSALVSGVARESLEELGEMPTELRYLGLLREFVRGGKPELYFYGRLSASMQQVAAHYRFAEGREESTELLGMEFHSDRVSTTDSSRYGFQERVRLIMDGCGDQANLTFVAGVLLGAAQILQRSARQ